MIKNKYLIKYRIRNQLSQEKMAEKVGVPLRTYQSYENLETTTAMTLLALMEMVDDDRI